MSKTLQYSLIILEVTLFIVFIGLLRSVDVKLDTVLAKVWDSGWKIMTTVGTLYFLFLYLRINQAERCLKKLYADKEQEKVNIQRDQVAQNVIDGRIRNVDLDYQAKISPIKRQRQYDLDKMPFLKK